MCEEEVICIHFEQFKRNKIYGKKPKAKLNAAIAHSILYAPEDSQACLHNIPRARIVNLIAYRAYHHKVNHADNVVRHLLRSVFWIAMRECGLRGLKSAWR